MTPAFASRRRADVFDALVSAPTRELDRVDAAYAELLALVGELRAVPAVSARQEFVTDLRSQLVVEAARLSRPVADEATRVHLTPRQRQGARDRRIATALGGFAIVAASGSMAMASQAALPGEVLYPVKRALENAETNLQSDDAAKAETLLAHAEQRLQEAEQLSATDADATTVAQTLQDFTDQSTQAADLMIDHYTATGDQDSIGTLRSFAAASMDDLEALGDQVPSDARSALITAAQSVLQVDKAAFQACPTCGDGAVTEMPTFAAEPVALESLLSLEDSALSVSLPLDYLERVEGIAVDIRSDGPKNGNDGPRGVDNPDDDTPAVPSTDPVTEPTDDTDDTVPGPLQDLGNKIKDALKGDKPSDVDPVVVDVSGVGGLVDDLLTAK